MLSLNSDVGAWDGAPNNVGQAFQPARSPDFPGSPPAVGCKVEGREGSRFWRV